MGIVNSMRGLGRAQGLKPLSIWAVYAAPKRALPGYCTHFREFAAPALLHRDVRYLDLGKLMVPLCGDALESEPKSFAFAGT
jgi:hypothetical protein